MIDLTNEEGLGKTASGIFLPVGPNPRAWIKLKGEPALVMYESPAEVLARFIEMEEDHEQRWLILHDYAFGQMNVFLRSALHELAFISSTHPTFVQTKTNPMSLYSRTCPCAQFGGPCPPVE